MLETGEDIIVMGSKCGHVWSPSAQEKQAIRKMLA
jgi:hypothetical protein